MVTVSLASTAADSDSVISAPATTAPVTLSALGTAVEAFVALTEKSPLAGVEATSRSDANDNVIVVPDTVADESSDTGVLTAAAVVASDANPGSSEASTRYAVSGSSPPRSNTAVPSSDRVTAATHLTLLPLGLHRR